MAGSTAVPLGTPVVLGAGADQGLAMNEAISHEFIAKQVGPKRAPAAARPCLSGRRQHPSLAGQEHGRTIRLADIDRSDRHHFPDLS
jgi:hypothetical protein